MKSRWHKVIMAVLVAACLAFIWSNSVMPASVSGGMSGFAVKILRHIFGENFAVSEAVIRKLAHGFEFAVLGCALSLLLYEKLAERIFLVGFCGLGAAVFDETIQLFSDGRASQVKDIWIDFGGFTAGALLIFLLYFVEKGMKGKQKRI